MRSSERENIAEHSMQVAVIAHALAVINNIEFDGAVSPEKVACIALFHETSEVLTGDLPTPIKYFNPAIREAYKNLEAVSNEKLLSYLPESMRPEYKTLMTPEHGEYGYKLVKAADKMSALIKCIDELKCGNAEFRSAKKTIEQDLDKMKIPEAEYFRKNFLGAYELTLDDLNN
jgi:5'-deoxynucleotidase